MSQDDNKPFVTLEEPRATPPTPPWLAEALQDWAKLKQDIAIDPQAGEIPLHLNQELFSFPEAVARWGFRLAEAIREEQIASLQAEDAFAAAEEKARILLGPTKRGEVSLADYERAAKRDPEWRQAELRRIAAEAKVGRLKAATAGLAAKRDALTSIGANLRAELQADPTLRDSSSGSRR